MSISGPGLYQDDTGSDVRSRFRELVADGLAGSDATDVLISEWGPLLEDRDQACAFWLALADTQCRTGRLEDRVRNRALDLIASGEDLARFERVDRLHRKRQVLLLDLRERMTGPQRSPVKIRKQFGSVSPVEPGDIFTFALPTGRTIWLRCVAINGNEPNNAPTVEVLEWHRSGIPSDPSKLPASKAVGSHPDLLWLARGPSDPDPAELVHIVLRGTPVSRSPFPATLVAWVDLEMALSRYFGIREPSG